MKKIISILFLSCFVICSPSGAQAQVLVKAARSSGRSLSMGAPVKLPKVLPIVSRQTVVKGTSINQMRNGSNSITPNSRVRTAVGSRPNLTRPSRNLRNLIPYTIPDHYLPSHRLMRERGFIPQEHVLSTSCIDVLQPSSPKVNLDKIRMKVMMKQNRLNKNEMIADKFILIGLLINYNEYEEYYITGDAAKEGVVPDLAA